MAMLGSLQRLGRNASALPFTRGLVGPKRVSSVLHDNLGSEKSLKWPQGSERGTQRGVRAAPPIRRFFLRGSNSFSAQTIRAQGYSTFNTFTDVKVINDNIHQHIEIHPLCVKIIDTPEFQRLRNLKQLGSVYLVYPGAAHNRFEHCLGVGHLANKLVTSLKYRQKELDITEKDVLCVTIAGLCHDLGQGPYSHLFEQFMKAVGRGAWRHEEQSVKMFQHLIKANGLKKDFTTHGLDGKDITFIAEQINGKAVPPQKLQGRPDKGFLYEIVANSKNGIDVDKWDYLARDSTMLGITNSFDYRRFLKHARVIKDNDGKWQICSRDKEAEDLYRLFHTRYFIFRRACNHRVHQSIEAMLVDALMCAEKTGAIKYTGSDGKLLTISQCVDDPVAYTDLDDSVFSLIQLSKEPELQPARDILRNIRKRNLYWLVDQTKPEHERLGADVLQELVASSKSPDKFVVKEMYLDYGMKEKNPVAETQFYQKSDPDKTTKICASEVSQILPQKFSEQVVRLFCKAPKDEATKTAAQEHFKQWCDRHNRKVAGGR